MKRRDFLKLFPALSATLIPTTFAIAAPEIKNTKDLTKYMESAFLCSNGFESRFISEELTNQADTGAEIDLKYVYTTLIYCSVGDDKVTEERRIAQYFYKKLNPMKGYKLIWRVKPEFDSKQIYEFGKVFMTNEDFEDSRDFYNLQLPENVAYDFDTDKYRYYENKYWLHRIRMRIAIPEAHAQLSLMDSYKETNKRIT